MANGVVPGIPWGSFFPPAHTPDPFFRCPYISKQRWERLNLTGGFVKLIGALIVSGDINPVAPCRGKPGEFPLLVYSLLLQPLLNRKLQYIYPVLAINKEVRGNHRILVIHPDSLKDMRFSGKRKSDYLLPVKKAVLSAE